MAPQGQGGYRQPGSLFDLFLLFVVVCSKHQTSYELNVQDSANKNKMVWTLSHAQFPASIMLYVLCSFQRRVKIEWVN